MDNPLAQKSLRAIWRELKGDPGALKHIQFPGQDPFYFSSFPLGSAAQISIGGAALAAVEVGRQKSGIRQDVSVAIRDASMEFRSERLFRVNNQSSPSLWDPLAGVYQCGQGLIRVHTNFPHHRENLLKLLNCEATRESVQKALSHWNAWEFEEAAHVSGCVANAMRSRSEWLRHPQNEALKDLPLVSIEKISEAPARPIPAGHNLLSGWKVLDLTRVIAGPVAARTLAAYGANVLRVHSPKLPALDWIDRDTGRGKRSTFIDLDSPQDRLTFLELVREADVFIQSYRPGGLQKKGVGPQDLFRVRPGLVYATLTAFGQVGPWSERKGFDSLTQTALGFNLQEAENLSLASPKELPCQALDHASGYLLAMGTMIARLRQSNEGGNWHVHVSLAQTANWIWDLGRYSAEALMAAPPDPKLEDVQDLMQSTDSPFGLVSYIRHAARFSESTAKWGFGPTPLGSDPPAW